MFSCGLDAPEALQPLMTYLFVHLRLPRFFDIAEDAFGRFVDACLTRMSLHGAVYHNAFHGLTFCMPCL